MKKKKKPIIGTLTALLGIIALLVVLSLKGCVLGLDDEENESTPTPSPTPEVTYVDDGAGILLSLQTYQFPKVPDELTPTIIAAVDTPTPTVNEPSSAPTGTSAPTPTVKATEPPTPDVPDTTPTPAPTKAPTDAPTKAPTKVPTKEPTMPPVNTPSPVPTKAPTPTLVPTPEPTSTPTPKPLQYASDAISVEINKQREANGVEKLATTDVLTSLAQKRLQEVIAADGFDALFSEETYEHFRLDGRPWYTLFDDAGISYFKRAEVFAYYKSNASQTVASLMSNSNRSYLMNESYREMGVAFNGEYVVILLKR